MDWEAVRQFLATVAAEVVRDNRPLLGRAGGRVVGVTAARDPETAADAAALAAIERRLAEAPFACALLDEKHGRFRALAGRPRILIVADESDGSRPHAFGMPTCATSLAALPADEEPVLARVRCGVIHTFDGVSLSFVRGRGIVRDGRPWRPPADATALADARIYFETMHAGSFALLGLYLAPFEPLEPNGVLSIASSAYAAAKLVEGAAHVHLHLGRRLWEVWPALRPHVEAICGAAPGQHGYDIAAAVPLLWEAGRVVTDGYGRPLDRLRLDDLTPFSQVSATNAALHQRVLEELDRQEQRLRARAAAVEALLLRT